MELSSLKIVVHRSQTSCSGCSNLMLETAFFTRIHHSQQFHLVAMFDSSSASRRVKWAAQALDIDTPLQHMRILQKGHCR